MMRRALALLLLLFSGCSLLKVEPAPPPVRPPPSNELPALVEGFDWASAGAYIFYAAAGLLSLAAGSREARKRWKR